MERIHSQEMQQFEKEHIAAMRALAPECMVLLKNEDVLPLAKVGKIALYGGGARRTIKGGTGSGDVNVRHFVNVEEGLENAGFEITTKAWMDAYDIVVEDAKKEFVQKIKAEAAAAGADPMMFGMGRVMPEPAYNIPLDGEGDTAIYVLARISGEGSDRQPVAGDINLTETEIRDILEVNAKYKKMVLVLNVGGMVDLSPVAEVKTVLLMGQLGSAMGDALADVLLGKSYPSGKLTMTWAPIDTYPSTEGFGHPDNTYYKEGIYVGYRYYDRSDIQPIYPFGFGMGYTTFTVTPVKMTADAEMITVTANVKNTGMLAGKEIVQVYYSAPSGKLDKPYQELAGYIKTKELQPQEEQEISISFATESMASYDTKRAAWILEAGTYYVRIGNCSRNTHICGGVYLDAEVITEKVKNICGEPGFADLKMETKAITYLGEQAEKEQAAIITIDTAKIVQKTVAYAEVMPELTGAGCSFADVKNGTKSLDEFVAGLTDEQMAYLCIGAYKESTGKSVMEVIGSASFGVAGAAGETTGQLAELGVEALVMADGPAGLRLNTCYTYVDGVAKGTSMALPETFADFLDPQIIEGMKDAAKKQKAEAGDHVFYQYCTALPIGMALAQSWNNELCRVCGDIIGKEMELFGVHLWLAPAMNIYRSPMCGRNFEYYSEDPVLSGSIPAAITEGVQVHPGCGTTIKHFACNNQETNRYFSNSILSERALREIYLKGFEICVKQSQPHTVMTSYNLINGEHACSSKDVQTYVLRDEWGFKGFVMTDWLVTGGMGKVGNVHPCASAAGCVKAGNDVIMPGMPSDKEDILKARQDASHPYALSKAELQTAAKRVLEMILKLA